jgi:SAM-dependent methyltransferase
MGGVSMSTSDDTMGQSDTSVAGQLNRYVAPNSSAALQEISIEELGSELLARIRNGVFDGQFRILLGCQIYNALRVALDIHSNRMSRKRYADMFGMVYSWWESVRPRIENATIVDLGCGSINPYGVLFLLLMLGAKRGVAIDLDEIQDVQQAVRALGDCAAMMLVDPKGLVGDYPISRAHVLQNIASFDLGRLGAGDPSGIDSDRLCFRRESVTNLSLSDGEADLVISHTFLEHVPYVEPAVAEMARVTRNGGFGVHLIDGADHRRYWDPNCHALKFLEESTSETLVHGSNRVRPREFIPVFEHHGFEVVEFDPFERIEVGLELRKQFAEPFRSMPLDSLGVIGARLLVRKL